MELNDILQELFNQGYTAVILYKNSSCDTYTKPHSYSKS